MEQFLLIKYKENQLKHFEYNGSDLNNVDNYNCFRLWKAILNEFNNSTHTQRLMLAES